MNVPNYAKLFRLSMFRFCLVPDSLAAGRGVISPHSPFTALNMQLVFLWLSDEKNKRCCNRCHRDHISGITRREAKSTDQQQILQTLCASIPRRNARYPVGIFTLLWFSLEAWMFCMCGHWSGGVYLLGLVMPEASLSVLLARALEVRAVDCDKERRENEWNLLIWKSALGKKYCITHNSLPQLWSTSKHTIKSAQNHSLGLRCEIISILGGRSGYAVCPYSSKNGKLSGKVCSLARVCQCFLLMAKSKMTHSSGFTFPHEEHLLQFSGVLKRRAPNGKALLHILHEAKIIYSCYLEKQSKPTVWKTAIIVPPQREKARLFFFLFLFVN